MVIIGSMVAIKRKYPINILYSKSIILLLLVTMRFLI